jgi:hypothetical protein
VIGDEADARRRKAIVPGHLMDQSMHPGIALPHRHVVEADELVGLSKRHIREPRANQPDDEIDGDDESYSKAELDLARRDHSSQDHAGDNADEQAEGDQRGEDKTKYDDPSRALAGPPL